MGEANEQDVFGQDLLSEALGQSGLNLDEYLGNAAGNVLSQAMLDVGSIGPNDLDFLDDINVNTRDFIQDTPYIALTTSNNSEVTSTYANVQEKSQVAGVQQTFLEQPRTLPNLTAHGIFLPTARQFSLTSQNQQFVSKASTSSSVQRLQSCTSPILLNLLNSGSNPPVSRITDTVQKELTKK